jgi:hypothetical protein
MQIGPDLNDTTSPLVFATNNATERARIDSSGNLGLGVTPSAWNTGVFKAIQINAQGALMATSASMQMGNNVFYDGAYKFIGTGYANRYYQTSGQHVWTVSTASGTAGGTITETQAMTLDASGNLLVGTTATTSGARFVVKGSGTTGATYNIFTVNSAGNMVFATEDGGTVYTGTLTDSPYNKTTGSAANMFVSSANGALLRSTSSLKYKKNVQDTTHGLVDILKLRAVTYEGKSEADAGKTFGGLIAEEVHAAGLTEFVQYADDGTPDALAYGHMVSLCVKAIQEQQALITQLQADVATLKGN